MQQTNSIEYDMTIKTRNVINFKLNYKGYFRPDILDLRVFKFESGIDL